MNPATLTGRSVTVQIKTFYVACDVAARPATPCAAGQNALLEGCTLATSWPVGQSASRPVEVIRINRPTNQLCENARASPPSLHTSHPVTPPKASNPPVCMHLPLDSCTALMSTLWFDATVRRGGLTSRPFTTGCSQTVHPEARAAVIRCTVCGASVCLHASRLQIWSRMAITRLRCDHCTQL